MKLRRRGMIRINIPDINATTGSKATLMVIEVLLYVRHAVSRHIPQV